MVGALGGPGGSTRSMTDIAINVEGVGKRYRLGERQPYRELRTVLPRLVGAPFRYLKSFAGASPVQNGKHDEFLWALKDVSFEIETGEVVGIIGQNGAGKSTLLKILSRITEPTEGEARIHGRVGSLLEVGTGFHPELTGRENIYLNGAILGMKRAEIESKFDDIVDFAEVARFVDTPLKRYSSGMYVRLAFAVAAHLEPDLLLVDEVLSVGDVEFQRKCLGKMNEVSQCGRTVVFVSHNMGAVERLCQRVIVLRGGRIHFMGPTREGIRRYIEAIRSLRDDERRTLFMGPLVERVHIERVTVNGRPIDQAPVVSPGDDIIIEVFGRASSSVSGADVVVGIEQQGLRITTLHDSPRPATLSGGYFLSEMRIPARFLRPGRYFLAAGCQSETLREWMWGRDLGAFTVLEEWQDAYRESMVGIVYVPFRGKRTHGQSHPL